MIFTPTIWSVAQTVTVTGVNDSPAEADGAVAFTITTAAAVSADTFYNAINASDVDRVIAIGSDRMMAAVAAARHNELKPFMKPCHSAFGSINSPMQCMMKEICGQCIQQHTDPASGKSTYVFSCYNQDQSLDAVNFAGLNSRLKQNNVQEKLTAQWIERCLKSYN